MRELCVPHLDRIRLKSARREAGWRSADVQGVLRG